MGRQNMKDFKTEGIELELDITIEELEPKIAPDDTLETVLPLDGPPPRRR